MDVLYQPDTLDALYGSGAGDTTPVKDTKAPPQSSPPQEKTAKVKLPKPKAQTKVAKPKGQSSKTKTEFVAKQNPKRENKHLTGAIFVLIIGDMFISFDRPRFTTANNWFDNLGFKFQWCLDNCPVGTWFVACR